MRVITTRDTANNLQHEPDYPLHDTVVISFKYPDYTVHQKHISCNKEYPHKISECGILENKL